MTDSAPNAVPGASVSDDPGLDAAIATHDAIRVAYEYRRRALRRLMYGVAFVVLVFGGIALIGAGLSSDAVANRIEHTGSIIVGFMMTLAGIVMTAFSAGAYEGASYPGSGMFGGVNSSFGGYRSAPMAPLRPSSRAD